MTIKKNFEMKFAYVTNGTVEISIKNHIYHYTTSRDMVICDSDGMTGDQPHMALIRAVPFFQ
jgi:hypothetical protein